MAVSIQMASRTEVVLVDDLLHQYLAEMAFLDGTLPDPDGRYRYQWIERYWTEPGRNPFLISLDGRTVGFALVMEWRIVHPGAEGWLMAEFFVQPSARRRGVGRHAASAILRRFQPPWAIPCHTRNTGAHAFWQSVLDSYRPGAYRVEQWDLDGEPAVAYVLEAPLPTLPPGGGDRMSDL